MARYLNWSTTLMLMPALAIFALFALVPIIMAGYISGERPQKCPDGIQRQLICVMRPDPGRCYAALVTGVFGHAAERDRSVRVFAGYPDVGLELVGTDVLDGRLVVLEYRPAAAE